MQPMKLTSLLAASLPPHVAQDVEGHEVAVMKTAQQALAAGAIDNIIMEYSPGEGRGAAGTGQPAATGQGRSNHP